MHFFSQNIVFNLFVFRSPDSSATTFVRRRRWITAQGLALLDSKGDPLARRRSAAPVGTAAPAVIVGTEAVVVND